MDDLLARMIEVYNATRHDWNPVCETHCMRAVLVLVEEELAEAYSRGVVDGSESGYDRGLEAGYERSLQF
jgi:hypothetical protein